MFFGERGIGAMCFSSDWLAQGTVTEITAEDFLTNSTKILGHDYGDDSMLVLREFLRTVANYMLTTLMAVALRLTMLTAQQKCRY